MKTSNLLIQTQKLEAEVNKLSATCPQKPCWFNKKKTSVDETKTSKEILDKINSLIEEKWKIEEKISKKAKALKKGDEVYYLENNTNKMLVATVVSQGKYKDDYNDFSGFVRIRDAKYSWNQSKNSIIKK